MPLYKYSSPYSQAVSAMGTAASTMGKVQPEKTTTFTYEKTPGGALFSSVVGAKSGLNAVEQVSPGSSKALYNKIMEGLGFGETETASSGALTREAASNAANAAAAPFGGAYTGTGEEFLALAPEAAETATLANTASDTAFLGALDYGVTGSGVGALAAPVTTTEAATIAGAAGTDAAALMAGAGAGAAEGAATGGAAGSAAGPVGAAIGAGLGAIISLAGYYW